MCVCVSIFAEMMKNSDDIFKSVFLFGTFFLLLLLLSFSRFFHTVGGCVAIFQVHTIEYRFYLFTYGPQCFDARTPTHHFMRTI